MTIIAGAELAELFRGAFRAYPTGVAVITARGPAGPVGLTASSVASVSVAPPALSFSVMDSPSALVIAAAPSLVVNLLGAGHAALAADFARAGGPRFTADQGWETLPTGEPVLAGAAAALRCEPLHRVPVGASTLVVAQVTEVWPGPPGPALIHHERRFTATT
ncbi:flavin reductase family protein [Dactylosporangium sp. AC04546]|uniref:flavin reductase family protein n=1 Tax=Dactylosporangium sp. AC04546 TaxID=2862460 RepID=UPI0027DF3293|nr:flavin reductase family protein [Dactylosporangium sp. AC04546]WVK86291.1 flavin reductase family protein [Dactylosporangium sp. AC04546]